MKIKKVLPYLPFAKMAKDTFDHTRRATVNIGYFLKTGFSSVRKIPSKQEISTFEQFKTSSGLRSEKDINTALKSLKISISTCVILIGLMFWGVWTAPSIFVFAQLFLVVGVLIFAIVTQCWKYSVLKNQQFVAFGRWLTGRN